MFKHVILWQLKDELTPELKETVKREAKAALEAVSYTHLTLPTTIGV